MKQCHDPNKIFRDEREKSMIFIENLLEIYYRYKAIVLNPVVIIVVLIGTLYELYFLNRKRENIEEPILRNILLSFIAICIGWIFYAAVYRIWRDI